MPNLMIRTLGLAAVISFSLVVPAFAQNSQPGGADVLPKDPSTGMLFAFLIPGGGHFYAEEPETGRALMLISAGGIFYGLSQMKVSCAPAPGEDDCDLGERELAIGLGVAAAAWIAGMADAGPAARRYNTRHGLGFSKESRHISRTELAGLCALVRP